ncbi:hypothetical protein ACWEN6_13735 [Sphaerisporangium sp. NPDC004334]
MSDLPDDAAWILASDASTGCGYEELYIRCGDEAVIVIVTACIHEHEHRIALCEFHVSLVEAGNVCGPCDDLGHHCPVTLLAEVTEQGERRVLPS